MRAKLAITLSVFAVAGGLAACSPKPAATDAATTSAAAPTEMAAMSGGGDMSGMAMDTDAGAKMGSGVGVITAIDKTAGTVTIKHDAIPAIDWPAMTMAFKATPASLLDGLKVGEKIKFDVTVKGSDAEVTAVTPQ
ncbi:copper-binding protein [Asticcacaulis taihuensis]|jgi:Cu/Ag efflux protein CusF|uniref:copper-binding protein n=1 Tax=Asticcacaulis taihuensis TaxID=260084 RepID=UPI0026EBE6D0|nr:copper-binding protein [Asticcacaulis taihuensis]